MLAQAPSQSLQRSSARPRRCPHTYLASLRRVRCAAAQAEKAQLFSLHLGETTLSLPIPDSEAQNMRGALDNLLQTFAEKQKAERPKRWKMMEYRYKGAPGESGIDLFELFCNPNAHSTPFDAKILVTMKAAQGVSLTTEGTLSAVKGDIDAYLDQLS
ncbi:hypothetical protein WJX74_009624 [Apatococcus lobatus]|uniref:Uncharacterized protein n=1 Tax=Apatococcus lobatus TaxID=904363 RepID=A0AAW1QD76_9CHLO